jgi:hypothetical protein
MVMTVVMAVTVTVVMPVVMATPRSMHMRHGSGLHGDVERLAA